MTLVVGIVTYNNLPMIQKCFESWRSIPEAHLVVWDNGSEPEVKAWLEAQAIDKLFLNPTNAGLCVGRNRIIEYNREVVRGPLILLIDSDVLFHEGSLEQMLTAMESDPDVGMVGFGQANQGFPVTSDGYVEELSNECILSRMDMWRQIGMFPESLRYYSSDSWKSTLANMHGWKTRIVMGAKGYDHFAHGSHVNRPVPAQMRIDQEHWLSTEAKFHNYWRRRLILGKGSVYKAAEEAGADWKVPDEIFEPDAAKQTLIKPTNLRQFTAWLDCQALIGLTGLVDGNYLEIGCHQGLTLMQLAFNCPTMMCYGIDCSTLDSDLQPEQAAERPSRAEIGLQVRSFRNAKVFDTPFQKFGMDMLEDVALVFIDADNSFAGVKLITERVLEYFLRAPKKRRVIAWHDYTPKRLRKDGDWIGVGDYVRQEIADRFVCRFIRNTNIAYATYTER